MLIVSFVIQDVRRSRFDGLEKKREVGYTWCGMSCQSIIRRMCLLTLFLFTLSS
jgi:hypothetical protein